MKKTPKLLEVKKLESGDFAVRWSNKPSRWNVISKDDQIIFEYMIFMALTA